MSWTIALVQMDCVAGDVAGKSDSGSWPAPPRRRNVAHSLFCFPNARLPATSWPIASRIWLSPSQARQANTLRVLRAAPEFHLMVGMIERAGRQILR